MSTPHDSQSASAAVVSSDKAAKYTLQVGAKGEERLGIINELYNPSTMAALSDYLAKGARNVLEVACGNGQIANWMAKQLAPLGGSVLAVDISGEQLGIARQNAQAAGITNVEYQQLSVFDLGRLE